jgi:hypothetical protein
VTVDADTGAADEDDIDVDDTGAGELTAGVGAG